MLQTWAKHKLATWSKVPHRFLWTFSRSLLKSTTTHWTEPVKFSLARFSLKKLSLAVNWSRSTNTLLIRKNSMSKNAQSQGRFCSQRNDSFAMNRLLKVEPHSLRPYFQSLILAAFLILSHSRRAKPPRCFKIISKNLIRSYRSTTSSKQKLWKSPPRHRLR